MHGDDDESWPICKQPAVTLSFKRHISQSSPIYVRFEQIQCPLEHIPRLWHDEPQSFNSIQVKKNRFSLPVVRESLFVVPPGWIQSGRNVGVDIQTRSLGQ